MGQGEFEMWNGDGGRLRLPASTQVSLIPKKRMTENFVKKKRKKALDGYVRKGKKFISPLKAMTNLRSYGYVDDLLPELLWIGLINDHCGYKTGRDVLECCVKTSQSWNTEPKNYALQSSYIDLAENQKEEIVNSWKSSNLLEAVQFSIAPLVLLFEECALRFVGPPPQVIPAESLVGRLERVVGAVSNKYEAPGVMLHGALMMNNLIAGRIQFASHIEIPDFNAVLERPNSDDARRAGSFLRASAMAQIGFKEPPKEWARYFWNTSYTLVNCEGESDERGE
jgi:hypothetical protein